MAAEWQRTQVSSSGTATGTWALTASLPEAACSRRAPWQLWQPMPSWVADVRRACWSAWHSAQVLEAV